MQRDILLYLATILATSLEDGCVMGAPLVAQYPVTYRRLSQLQSSNCPFVTHKIVLLSTGRSNSKTSLEIQYVKSFRAKELHSRQQQQQKKKKSKHRMRTVQLWFTNSVNQDNSLNCIIRVHDGNKLHAPSAWWGKFVSIQ
jgi:hypothetical protein